MNTMKYVLLGALLGLSSMVTQANLVYDGDFETLAPDTIIDDTGGYHQWGDNAKWVSNPTGAVVRAGIGGNSTQVLELRGDLTGGVVYQNTGFDLADGVGIENTTFDWSLSYYIPAGTTSGGFSYSFSANSGWNIPSGFGAAGYIAWDSAAADTWHTASGTFTVDPYTVDTVGGNWYMFKMDITRDAASNGSIYMDDVTLTAVPEPATLGMIAAFGGGILFIRRRLVM